VKQTIAQQYNKNSFIRLHNGSNEQRKNGHTLVCQQSHQRWQLQTFR